MSAEEARAEAERRYPYQPVLREGFEDGAEWQASREHTIFELDETTYRCSACGWRDRESMTAELSKFAHDAQRAASREVTEAEEIAGAEALHEATWGTTPINDERYWVETRKQARAVLVAAREVRS